MIQIAIERIGDDSRQAVESQRRGLNTFGTGLGDAIVGKATSRAWCAEITGFDPKYRYRRRFLRPNISYQHANGIGSRGVYAYYNLEETGVYEISEPTSWTRTDRYFAQVMDGELRRITKEDVDAWLNTVLG